MQNESTFGEAGVGCVYPPYHEHVQAILESIKPGFDQGYSAIPIPIAYILTKIAEYVVANKDIFEQMAIVEFQKIMDAVLANLIKIVPTT